MTFETTSKSTSKAIDVLLGLWREICIGSGTETTANQLD